MANACAPEHDAALRQAVANLPSIPGRLERVGVSSQPIVVVDYAHTADALRRALSVMCALDQGEVTVVFGCGGERDPTKRAPMMRAALEGATQVVATNDNPRGEDPDAILDAMMDAVPQTASHRVARIPDRRAAIAYAIEHARGPVLIAGKGHEQVQIIGDQRLPFDDREEALKILNARLSQ